MRRLHLLCELYGTLRQKQTHSAAALSWGRAGRATIYRVFLCQAGSQGNGAGGRQTGRSHSQDEAACAVGIILITTRATRLESATASGCEKCICLPQIVLPPYILYMLTYVFTHYYGHNMYMYMYIYMQIKCKALTMWSAPTMGDSLLVSIVSDLNRKKILHLQQICTNIFVHNITRN